MARATHIAVNLLLIVAVTMQPGLAYALGQHCSAGVSTGFTCLGCGNCKVQLETASCPCCSGEATTDEGECCGHGQKKRHRVETFGDDPFTGMELQKGPVPEDTELPRYEHSSQVKADDVVALSTACHCVTAPEPFDAPVPRSPTTELREVLAVHVACVGDVSVSEEPPLSSFFECARRPVEPHFAQIAFCVWRL